MEGIEFRIRQGGRQRTRENKDVFLTPGVGGHEYQLGG